MIMIPRIATERIASLAAQFPAVLILGPRQCGKTTLARSFIGGDYFDLERPSDRQVFADDIEYALRQFRRPIIIDEAQEIPELFPVLRAIIDENRAQPGRFYLLGSVNPALVRQISESLAGRVGIVELTPFLFTEAAAAGFSLETAWLKGGFPDALQTANVSQWSLWQENYRRTYIERDLIRYGLNASPVRIGQLLGMIAARNGGLLNQSELGRTYGASYHTIGNYLDLLEGHFIVRRLPPYHANIGKRLVKSPKVYLRDTGLLHFLMGISELRQLMASTQKGASFEQMMIEQIIGMESLTAVGSRFYFYRSHAGAEIDLVVDRGSERIGFEFKCGDSAGPKDWANLKSGISDGIIHRGILVNMGRRRFQPANGIDVVPAQAFLTGDNGEDGRSKSSN